MKENSKGKAMEVYERLRKQNLDGYPDLVIGHFHWLLSYLGCDTVVECDGKILEKPKSVENAVAMLTALSGRSHCVYSGVTIICWRFTKYLLIFSSPQRRAGACDMHFLRTHRSGNGHSFTRAYSMYTLLSL